MRETAGSATAPVAKCKNLRRGSFISITTEELEDNAGAAWARIDLSVASARVKDQHTFRAGTIELVLLAVRGRSLRRDKRPRADELLLQRFLLGDCAPLQQSHCEHGARRDA